MVEVVMVVSVVKMMLIMIDDNEGNNVNDDGGDVDGCGDGKMPYRIILHFFASTTTGTVLI
jgi:hypothetical protein